MPKQSPHLILELAAPLQWTYAPGDKIIGNIVQKDPIVAPEATLTLTLNGYVKTSFSDKQRNNPSQYKEQRQLLAPNKRVIFKGPLHLEKANIEAQNECLSWPFEVTIPTRPWVSLWAAPRETRYKTLPGSFFSGENDGKSVSLALVVYYLEAKLEYNRSGSLVQSIARAPIKLRHPMPGQPVTSHELRQETARRAIHSYRLLPEMENAELTLRQRLHQCLSSNKVPHFDFLVKLETPTVVQLNDPNPVPLRLSVVPNLQSTSEIIRHVPQIVQLNQVKMILSCSTQIGSRRAKHRCANDKHYDVQLESLFGNLESPLIMAAQEGNKLIDLGGMFHLGIRTDGFTSAGKLLSRIKIEPDFETYNFTHTHYVEYEVSITVAGEVQTAKFSRVKLKIVGCMNPSAVDDR